MQALSRRAIRETRGTRARVAPKNYAMGRSRRNWRPRKPRRRKVTGDHPAGAPRQITNSWAISRTSISKSRPRTGGREMPGQTARRGPAADDLVGQERMDVEDRI